MNNNQYEYITGAINVEDMVIISDDFAIGSSYSNKVPLPDCTYSILY